MDQVPKEFRQLVEQAIAAIPQAEKDLENERRLLDLARIAVAERPMSKDFYEHMEYRYQVKLKEFELHQKALKEIKKTIK